MKYVSICVLLLLGILFFHNTSFAYDVWEIAHGIKETSIKEVAASPYQEGVIYAASSKRLYRTDNNGKSWKIVFSARENGNTINFIKVTEQDVFVCTAKGLFKSNNGKSHWKNIFEGIGTEENNARHIAISNNNIYLATQGGLFIGNNNGASWAKDTGEAGNNSIKWISLSGNTTFISTEKGVYKKDVSGWKRVFVTTSEETLYDSEASDENLYSERPVNSILVKDGQVFLATDDGIFVSNNKKVEWKRFPSNGLISQKVKRLLFDENLFAVTDKGIFVFKKTSWEALYKGMDTDKTNAISKDTKRIIWAATEKGLFKSRLKSGQLFTKQLDVLGQKENNILSLFEHEPKISEVQNIAIKYAEVHPDKIKKWREAVKNKAWLPKLSIGIDDQRSDTYEIYTASSTHYYITGPDDRTYGWDASLTWDLGDIIWNSSQTSIDVRSKLMVQLRDDILDEATRTYFERRRLQIETYISPPSDIKERMENELRIQELTADLDALTGGYFSAQIE